MTYRQFDVILNEAPQCFRQGCENATSMSSPCPSSAPCHPLWELLRLDWQQEWCKNCTDDVACRIRGWPVLNGTEACNVSPGTWLFSGSGSGCCAASENETLSLSAWMGMLCNASEWRAPFAYYDNMAQLDWAEWVEPWNWTVYPSNSSLVTNSDIPMPAPPCKSSFDTLAAFAIDNASTVATALFQLVWSWVVAICKRKSHNDDEQDFSYRWTILLAFPYAIIQHLGNLESALLWRTVPGYENIEWGRVALLLFARPYSNPWLSYLGLFSFRISSLLSKMADAPDTKVFRRKVNNTFRRLAPWLRGQQETQVADLPSAEDEAQRLLNKFAVDTAFGEFLMQAMTFYSTITTRNVGLARGLYSSGALLPYWNGTSAYHMYVGALIHLIFAPFTWLALTLAVIIHLRQTSAIRIYERWTWSQRTLRELTAYRNNTRPETREQVKEGQRMARKLRLLERHVRYRFRRDPGAFGALGGLPGGSEKRTWRNDPTLVQRVLLRAGNRLRGRRWTDPIPDREFRSGKYPILAGTRRAGIVAALYIGTGLRIRPLQDWAEEANRKSEALRFNAQSWVDPDRLANIRRIMDDPRYRENSDRRQSIITTSFRRGSQLFLLFCIGVNYASQWLFWSGYIQSSEERWCPPDKTYAIERGSWAALSFAGEAPA
jgi:hypothetical protein